MGPRSSETVVELETFSLQTGGAVGTALATVCALGGQASYFGRLSDDEFGSMILRGLKAFGVDMSSVLIEPGKISPTSFILVDERTGRRLVRFTRGSTTQLDPGELPRKLLDDARILLVDGRNPATHIAAAERARAAGVTVMLDARRLGGGMGELLDLSRHRDRQRALRRRVLAFVGHEAQPGRADADGAAHRGHHAGRGGRDRRWRARRWCASRRCRSRSTTPTAPARCSGARSSTASSRAGRWTAACRSPTPPPRLNCRHLGGTGGIPTLAEVTQAAGMSA